MRQAGLVSEGPGGTLALIRSEPGSTGGFGARADLQVGRRTPAATGSADCGEQGRGTEAS